MRRQPLARPENILALATAEIERIKALLVRITDGRDLIITGGSSADDTTPVVEAGAHTLYGVKHTRAFRVTDGGGLDVDFEQGQIWMGGTFYSVAASSLTLADNDISYVFVDNSGAVADNTTGFPGDCWPVAVVTTVAGDITALADRRSYAAQGVWDGSMDADEILLPRVTGSTYDDVEDANTLFGSAGWFSGGVISDAGGETINVTAGTGVLRSGASALTQLLFFDWGASNGLAIATDTVRYIGVEWNGGSPQVTVRNSDNFNHFTDFDLAIVVNDGGTLYIAQHEHHAGDTSHNIIERLHQTDHIERDNEEAGLLLSDSADGNNDIAVSAGALWTGLDRFVISAVDTSGAGTFDGYSSQGKEDAGIGAWPNTLYDNGGGGVGTLQTMTNNWWANLWWYICTTGNLIMVYGSNHYAQKAQAENETLPSTLPDRITAHGILIGRFIFQKGQDASEVLSAFTATFAVEGVTDHGGLAGLTDSADHVWALLVDGTRNLAGDLLVNTDKEIQFRANTLAIFSSAADQLDLRAVTTIKLDVPTTTFTGQLQATVQGIAGGILIGGDAQWYRSAGDIMMLASGDTLAINDVNFALAISAGNPTITFDTNDYAEYNRAGNYFTWVIANTEYLRLTASDLKIDVINELVGAAGVTIEGVLLKDGDVGIGTSSPQSNLHIESGVPTIRLSDSDAATDQEVATLIEFWRGNNTNRVGYLAMDGWSNDILALATDYPDGELRFRTGSAVDRLTIDKDGNVGIGVVDPDALLEVAGTLHVQGASVFDVNLSVAGELIFDRANAISTLSKSRQVAGDQFLDIDFDGLTASEDARVRFFRSTTTAGGDDRLTIYVPGTSTVSMEFYANTGRMALPVVGSAAGLLIGGDVQLYRSTADVLYIPDSVTITGTELVDTINEFTADEGVELENVVLRDGILWGQTVYPELGIGDQIELTLSGNEITDKTRALAVGGDGRVFPDSSFGIWEATENLVTNGGFETNTVGWQAGGTNAIAISTAQAKFGLSSMLCTYGNNSSHALYTNTLSAAEHTVSAWLYIPSDFDGGGIRFLRNGYVGATGDDHVDADMSLVDQWQYLTFTFTPVGDMTGWIQFLNISGAPTAGRVIYVDGIQIEVQPIATPYVETDGGAATRVAAQVQAPASVLDETQGWWAVRVRVGWDYDDAPYNLPYLCSWQDDATHRISFYYDEGGSIWVILNWTGAGADAATSAAQTFSAGDLITIIGKWEAADLGISVDGAAFLMEGDRDSGLPGLAAATFDIGSQGGGDTFDGDFLWVAAGKGTLTDADARLINACGNTPPNRSVLPTVSQPTFLWDANTGAAGPDILLQDPDVFYVDYLTGDVSVGGELLSHKIMRKPADETLNNDNAIQDDDDLVFAVGVNEEWQFEFVVFYTSTANAGFKMNLSIPAGASGWKMLDGTGVAAGGQDITTERDQGLDIGSVHTLRGTVEVGATAGNIQFRWSQSVSHADNTTVLEHSYVKAWRIS